MHPQVLIVRAIYNNVVLLHPDANKIIEDIDECGEFIKTLAEAINIGLEDHLKEKFKGILKVIFSQ